MGSKSNYPNGFENGITIRNKPIDLTISGNVYFVGKTPEGQAGSNGYSGTYNHPFATIDFAIGKCLANHGDIIFVKAGHTETLSAAGAITADVAGISIIGLGSGADRPTLTFGTLTSASFAISAASVTIENIIGKSALDALANPFNVTGSDCWLDLEWQDASATVEAERAVLATTVSRLFIKVKYVGFVTGNACVNAVRLVEVTGFRVIVDAYGEFSTGIVEMITTASTDGLVSGYFYNDNAALTKNVVNTGGLACTWFAYGYDGKGGYAFSGGSAAALASDDASTIIATLGALNDAAATGVVTNTDTLMAYAKQLVTEGIARDAVLTVLGAIDTAAATGAVTATDLLMAYVKQLVTELQVVDEFHDVPAANNVLNAQINEVIGNKEDTAAAGAVTTTDTLVAYIKQLVTELAVVDEFHDVPAANNVLNAQINEVVGNKEDTAATGAVTTTDTLVGYIKQLVTEGIARDVLIAALGTKGICRLGKDLAAAAITGTATQFTVSGGPIRVLALGVLVTTALPAGANTLQFSFTPTGGGATTLSGATDTASAAIQQLFMLDGVKLTAPVKTTDPGILAGGQLLVSAGQGVVLSTGVIQTVFSAGPPATGAVTVFVEYEPLVVGATVA